jgi:DNA repair photolyase
MANHIQAKTILNRKQKRDSWFLDDYTLNPYSGCSFNCLFCYIRGSKYGEHMERKLAVKANAPTLLEKALKLRSRKKQHGFIVLASATDPYLQLEKETRLTRRLLEIILQYRFPVHLLTRSDLVLRDLDLLQEIDRQAIVPEDLRQSVGRGLIMTFSFSTVDDEIARIFEPGATPPSQRLEVMQSVADLGLLTGVSMMPLLPYISDTAAHLEQMFAAFRDHGAHYVMPAPLTLFGQGPSDSRTLVLRAVARHYPDLLPKYQQWFGTDEQPPLRYRHAFFLKMEELKEKYGLRHRIGL